MAEKHKPQSKKPSTQSARRLDEYGAHLDAARAVLGYSDQPPLGESTDAAWRDYFVPLNSACAETFEQGGGFFNATFLGFTAADMKEDGVQLETLSAAEEMLEAQLADLRAAKETVKRRVVLRSGKLVTSLRCRIDDPQTSPADRKALQKIAARPLGIIEESRQAASSKKRSTLAERSRVAEVEAEIESKELELKVLKGQQLTLADLSAARQRSRRSPRSTRR